MFRLLPPRRELVTEKGYSQQRKENKKKRVGAFTHTSRQKAQEKKKRQGENQKDWPAVKQARRRRLPAADLPSCHPDGPTLWLRRILSQRPRDRNQSELFATPPAISRQERNLDSLLAEIGMLGVLATSERQRRIAYFPPAQADWRLWLHVQSPT